MLRRYRNLFMSFRLVMAASAALALSAPVIAAPAVAVAAVQAAAVTEAQMEAKTQAFEARMAEMNKELQAALDGSGGDATKAKADTDAIITRYTPEITSFTTDFESFLNGQIASETDAEKRQQMETIRDQALPVIRTIPDQLRNSIQQAINNRPAAD